MYFKLNIAGKEVLLNNEQLKTIIDTLHGCDSFTSEYVGNNRGDNNGNYLKCVRTLDLSEIATNPLPSDYVETIRLRTKLADEKK